MTAERDASGLLRSFLDVSLHLSLELDVERALAFVVERSMEFIGAKYGAVATVDPSGAFDRFLHRGAERRGNRSPAGAPRRKRPPGCRALRAGAPTL